MMRSRRGSALILVLLMTLAIAGLSIAAIFMSSSAGLLSAFYDRERTHQFAAEAGLELARSRIAGSPTLAVPDTGMMQLIAGQQIMDASGNPVRNVRVNVYAAVTGDTTGGFLPTLTLVSASYDAGGTRVVRRLDLRRESFSRYELFVDSFPSSRVHGPATVTGRVHSNGAWRNSGSGNWFRDTVSAPGGFTGSGTYDIDSLVSVPRVPYPRDSTYPRLTSIASATGLGWNPITGNQRGSHLEFVAFDFDNDGVVEPAEGFARVFELADTIGADTTRLKVAPTIYQNLFGVRSYDWRDLIIQNQCGAFYRRRARWHFIPVAAHRASWVRTLLMTTISGDYPSVSGTVMDEMEDYDRTAAERVLSQSTARCFPAGSPYLINVARLTNSSGVVTGTSADVHPWGTRTPPGGWPADAPYGYGGQDTTFTARSFSCVIDTTSAHSGSCHSSTRRTLGNWAAWYGTLVSGLSPAVRDTAERRYLWPLTRPMSTSSRGVMHITNGPVFVSGTLRGRLTILVDGRVEIVDQLRYFNDPNDPSVEPCTDQLGIVARGDILIVEGLTTRVRRIASSSIFSVNGHEAMLGAESRFTLHGTFMSLTGTVGVEGAGSAMGSSSDQIPCPDDGGSGTRANGGCLALTGGMVMRTYSPLQDGSDTGFRYYGTPDRCQTTERRPPFFPLTNRYTAVRTLDIDPTLANSPSKIRALLLRLKGKSL